MFRKGPEAIENIRKSIKLKYELISSKYFDKYSLDVSKNPQVISSEEAQEYFTSNILSLLNYNYNSNDIIKIFQVLMILY